MNQSADVQQIYKYTFLLVSFHVYGSKVVQNLSTKTYPNKGHLKI